MAAGATRARWSGGRGSAAISLQVIIVVLAAVAQGLAPTAPTARGVVVTANKGTATTPGPPTVRHRMNLKADVDATPVSPLTGSPGTSTAVDVPVVAKTAASTTIRPPTVSSRTSFAESEGSSPKPEPDRAKPGAAGTAVELGAQPTAEPFGPGDKHRPSAVPAERPVRLRPETSLPSSTTRPRTTEPPASHQAGRARISSGDRPTPQPSPQPAKQHTRQLASQPASQLASQPASQTTTQPPSQPASQPTTQLASQPPSLPTTQLASQPPSQRASQPATQLASQPASQPAEWPQRRPTATAEAAAKIVGKPPARKPTAQPVSMASQGERPQAADATPATHPSPPAPPGPIRTPEDETTAAPHPSDEDQYPMYAEYPDSTANLTNNSGGEEGDVVPDPDAALRQDAEDEDERERASLAEDDAAASVPIDLGVSVGALSGQGGSSVGVVFDSVGDLRMSSGMLDAGFEHEPVEESVAEILDIPVEPATDQDLRERDRLDGDVYHEHERAELQLHNQGAAGKQVVIVGAALALVAQFLCLASATRRLRPGHVDVSTAVLFNVELALVVENLVFMLGVQSVGEPLRCQWVALALHYLHLVAAGWFLANTAFLAYRLRFGQLPSHFRPVALTVWTFPAVLVSAMYAAQPRSYETHRYCWMAVQRGMLLTFVAPVTIMITINTALALRGLRARSKEDADTKEMSEASAEGGVLRRDAASPAEMRSSLRAAAAMLPLYSADWFLGVVAMDNSTFLTYPLLFLVSNGFLNWFMMVCAWLIVPRESNKDGNDWCGGGDGDDLDDEDELLMEDDDAGCWGKSSPSDSLLPPLGAALDQTALWGATLDEHAAILSPPRIRGQADQSRTRWGEDHEREDRGETSTYMRDVDLCPGGPAGPAGTGCPSRPGQELAEMRYDGGISTISS